MATMMMLGPVQFSIDTAAYQNLKRTTEYRWGKQERLGHPILKHFGIGGPAYQYIGPGDESVNLDGTIYPHFKGGPFHLALMRLAAGSGIAMPLIESSGFLLGRWVIMQVDETNSLFLDDGKARKIQFSLALKRYSEDIFLFF